MDRHDHHHPSSAIALLATLAAALWIAAVPPVPARAEAPPAALGEKGDPARSADADDPDDLAKYGRLDQRIRAAARRDHPPARAPQALLDIFAQDVDLRRAARPGDGFVIVLDKARRHSAPRIRFAALTH